MNRHAHYEVVDDRADALVIRDLGPWDRHMTVTNDAEWVVEQLASRLAGRRLFYYDSDGELDELIVRNGWFAGFAPGAPASLRREHGGVAAAEFIRAVAAALRRLPADDSPPPPIPSPAPPPAKPAPPPNVILKCNEAPKKRACGLDAVEPPGRVCGERNCGIA